MNGTDFPALAQVLEEETGILHLQYRRTECMIMCMGQELH